MASEEKIIPVDLVALIEDQESASPIVVLHDRIGNRVLPIWIGDVEARAIAVALVKITVPRPLTHTLLLRTIEAMGGRLSRIVINRIFNNTYFALLYIQIADTTLAIDARPSDSIALAISARVPIFVAKVVMDTASQPNPFPSGSMQQEKRELKPQEVEKLRKLLEKVREREKKASGDS